MYSHGGFGRSSGCTLQFTSAELLPLHNFQKWDCRCRWAYSFGIGEVWWLNCPPKESVEGDDTVLRGSVRAPKGFSKGKPEAAKPRGRSPQGFAAEGLPEENLEGALTLPQSKVSAPEALSWGDSYSTLPQGFSTVDQTTKIMRFTGE